MELEKCFVPVDANLCGHSSFQCERSGEIGFRWILGDGVCVHFGVKCWLNRLELQP